jgi:hypothetical protein
VLGLQRIEQLSQLTHLALDLLKAAVVVQHC